MVEIDTTYSSMEKSIKETSQLSISMHQTLKSGKEKFVKYLLQLKSHIATYALIVGGFNSLLEWNLVWGKLQTGREVGNW